MDWISLAVSLAKGIGPLIEAIAKLAGEKTETVKARVIAELNKGEGDATDSIAGVIAANMPDSSDR